MPQHPEEQQANRRPIGLSMRDRLLQHQEQMAASAAEQPEAPDPEVQGGLLVSTARGVGRAANEVHQLVDSFGQFVADKTGASRLTDALRSRLESAGVEEDTLAEMFDAPHQAPFDIGERPGGMWGFYEGAIQFTAGFVPAVRAARIAGITNVALRGAAAGAVTDFSVWDPHEARLANLIADGSLTPEVVRPLARLLEADEDDSELVGRVKSSLEGLLLGTTIDSLVAGARIIRTRRAHRAGRLTTEEADEEIRRLAGELTDEPDAPFGVRETEEGFEVTTPKTEPTEAGKALLGDAAAPEAPQVFPTRAQAEKSAASLNLMDRLLTTPRAAIELTPVQRTRVKMVAARVLSGADPQDALRLLGGSDFNFGRVTSAEETRALIEALSEVLDEPFGQATNRAAEGRGVSNQDLYRMAEHIVAGVSGPEMVNHLRNLTGVTQVLPQTLLAARMVMHGSANRVSQIARAVDLDPTNVLAVRTLTREMNGLATLAIELAGNSANVARTLQAHAIKVGDDALAGLKKQGPERAPRKAAVRAFTEMTKRYSARELATMARTLRLTDGDPEAMLRAMRLYIKEDPAGGIRRGFWDKIVSFRASMMLSGLRTQFVNLSSSTLAALQVPTEVMVGGLITGNKAVARQGLDMLTAPLWDGAYIVREAAVRFKESFRAGRSILDPQFIKDEHGVYRTWEDPNANLFVKTLGLPGRTLTSADEFVKRMSYLSYVRAQSLRQLREEAAEHGLELTTKDINNRVYDDLIHSVDEGGEALRAQALEHARQVTFTNKLHPGTLGHGLQEMANNNVAVRFVVPFVRTPVNIFRFAHQRMPGLSLLSKEMREMLTSSDPDVRSVAVGRQAMGLLGYSMAGLLAYNGQITGRGPADPKLRSQLLESGWQPYSARVGSQWISFRRLEPIATPLGIMADMFDFGGEMGEESLEELTMAGMAAFTASVSSKSFLIGLTEFFEAVGSGEEYQMRQFMSSFVTSFTPALARQANLDPYWRETNSLLESVMSTLPGVSRRLETRRNIFGEQVIRPTRQAINGGRAGAYLNTAFNPFTVMSAEGIDDIQYELFELGKAISMPSEVRADGRINLRDRNTWANTDPSRANQSPYDRWMELVAEGNLRGDIARLMRSERWQSLSSGDNIYAPGGQKLEAVQRIVTKHHERARRQMLREYTDLARALREDPRLVRRARRGAE